MHLQFFHVIITGLSVSKALHATQLCGRQVLNKRFLIPAIISFFFSLHSDTILKEIKWKSQKKIRNQLPLLNLMLNFEEICVRSCKQKKKNKKVEVLNETCRRYLSGIIAHSILARIFEYTHPRLHESIKCSWL